MDSFDANSQRHHVVYDDGDEEKTLDFGKEKILLPLWDISKKKKLDRRGGYLRRRSKSDVTFYIVMHQKNIEVDYPLGSSPGPGGCVEAVSGEKVK